MSFDGVMLHLPLSPQDIYTPDNSYHRIIANGDLDVLTVPNELRSAAGPSTPVPVSKHEASTPVIAEPETAAAPLTSSGSTEPSALLRKALTNDLPSADPAEVAHSPPPTIKVDSQAVEPSIEPINNAEHIPTATHSALLPTSSKFHPLNVVRNRARSSPSQPAGLARSRSLDAITGHPGASKKPTDASRLSVQILPRNGSTVSLPSKTKNGSSASPSKVIRDKSLPMNAIQAGLKEKASSGSMCSIASTYSNASRIGTSTTHSFAESTLLDRREEVMEPLTAAQEWERGIDAVSALLVGSVFSEHGAF